MTQVICRNEALMHQSIVWNWYSGLKVAYTWPHTCNNWDPRGCDEDCEPRSLIGSTWSGAAPWSFYCRFTLRQRQQEQGYWLQFYCMDGDDTDWCMDLSMDTIAPKSKFEHLFRWLDAQPILDISLLCMRLRSMGFRNW